MTTGSLPFNIPYVPSASRRYFEESLQSGHLSGDGPMTHAVLRHLREITGSSNHLLTPSCTHALELACRLIDLRPGDEVIIPSFNFPSAATAIALTGATPVFADVDPMTKNITVNEVTRLATANTRAVVVLHYAGVEAPVSEIRLVTDSLGAYVIEDTAHAFGVRKSSGTLGSIGHFAAYSFHETKNFQCGEGGALQVNDPAFMVRAEIMREKGTDRSRFFRGQVDKYSWVDIGSSWLLADPLAAVLLGQLEEFDTIQDRRARIIQMYRDTLESWALEFGVSLSSSPVTQEEAGHMFYLTLPSLEARTSFLSHMREYGILAAFHYQPLHSSVAGRLLGRSDDCPVSTLMGDTLVRLPVYPALNEAQVLKVADAVTAFRV